MRKKLVIDIKEKEDNYTPQWIKDWQIQKDIDKLLRRPWMSDEDLCSLEPRNSWQNENTISHKGKLKAQAKRLHPVRKTQDHAPVKISSEEVYRNSRAKTLAELYLAGILLKMGSEVALMRKSVGYDMLVLTADNKIERLNVVADRNINSNYISIATRRVFNGKIVMDIETTLAHYYLIKICGTTGLYQITTSKLREIVKEHGQKKTSLPCDNGYYESTRIDRDLLLSNCEGLNL